MSLHDPARRVFEKKKTLIEQVKEVCQKLGDMVGYKLFDTLEQLFDKFFRLENHLQSSIIGAGCVVVAMMIAAMMIGRLALLLIMAGHLLVLKENGADTNEYYGFLVMVGFSLIFGPSLLAWFTAPTCSISHLAGIISWLMRDNAKALAAAKKEARDASFALWDEKRDKEKALAKAAQDKEDALDEAAQDKEEALAEAAQDKEEALAEAEKEKIKAIKAALEDAQDQPEYMTFACEVSKSRLVKKVGPDHMRALCNDFGVPGRGDKIQLAERLAEQLHYETDEDEDQPQGCQHQWGSLPGRGPMMAQFAPCESLQGMQFCALCRHYRLKDGRILNEEQKRQENLRGIGWSPGGMQGP